MQCRGPSGSEQRTRLLSCMRREDGAVAADEGIVITKALAPSTDCERIMTCGAGSADDNVSAYENDALEASVEVPGVMKFDCIIVFFVRLRRELSELCAMRCAIPNPSWAGMDVDVRAGSSSKKDLLSSIE